MAHFIAYKVLSELHCVVEYYLGELCLTDLLEYQIIVAKDSNYNPSFNIISDFRESTLKVNEQDVETFIDFVKKHRPVAKRQSAILTFTPKQFAISQLYTMHLGSLPMNVTVISTIEAALKWVNIPLKDKTTVEETIVELKRRNNYNDV